MNQVLKMNCDRCAVSPYCPEKGRSPLFLSRGFVQCHIIGGYGREPVDSSILSEETRKEALRNGGCLTIAEVPFYDDVAEHVERRIVKVFSPPVKHPRERTSVPKGSDLYPSSHKS